ncbi:MAG: alpha/beta fold hydrolase [Thermoleophilaceae bacterium]
MKHPAPDPPELGAREGLSYALFLPDEDPPAGVVIVHGAGSAKESHFDFARMLRSAGLAALAFDARGHGRSEGEFGPGAFDDVRSMCSLLREHAPKVALRGSSMGGFCAINAAASEGADVAAVVAICPASEDLLLRGLRSGRLDGFRAAPLEVLELWLESVDTTSAAASLGPETALLLLHAQGDEQVPFTISQELHEAARDPKRLLLLPGGHHRSLQHDMELQAVSLRFIQDAVGVRAVEPRDPR